LESYFYLFGDLGSGAGFIKMMTQDRVNQAEIIKSYLAFKILISIALFFGFTLFLLYYFFISQTREILGISLVCFTGIFGILSGYFTNLINIKQEYTKLSLLKTIPPLIKTLLIILLYFLDFRSFYPLLFAFFLPAFISLIMGFYYNSEFLPTIDFKSIYSKYGRDLYSISKWVCIINFCQTGFSQIDIFMLKTMSSDYQLAQFISAQKFSTIVLMLSQAIFTVMLPQMHQFKMNWELVSLTKKMFILYLVFLILLIPISFILPLFVPIILGPSYIDSIPILKVFVFQALGGMFISAQSLIFYRKNLLNWLALFTSVQLLLNFAGNYLVIFQYKALGAIWVSALLNNLFYLFISCFCLIFLNKQKN
jgi:O-antigen/teichoic acid export membrane protein